MSQEDQKELFKEALKEWLDEKFSLFGKWAFASILAAFFSAVVYFVFIVNGWK